MMITTGIEKLDIARLSPIKIVPPEYQYNGVFGAIFPGREPAGK